MSRIAVIIWVLLLGTPAFGYQYKFFLGVKGSKATLTSGDYAKFPLQNSLGFNLGYNINDKWQLQADFSFYDLTDDSTASSSFTFSRDEGSSTRKWKATRVGMLLNYRLLSFADKLRFHTGAGGGLMIWKYADPGTDSTFDAVGVHNEIVDYAASEVFLSLAGQISFNLSEQWALSWDARGDYLTGGGAEFTDDFVDGRERWLFNTGISLNFFFGKRIRDDKWRSDRSWKTPDEKRNVIMSLEMDSDYDGVPDDVDECLNTPPGAVVDTKGCPLDSDHDGVSDGLDDCQGTDRLAEGMVDVWGCPVDSDFDGVPDYLDRCPNNKIGAIVDTSGCPVDSDADGVPDGLDDCPNTLYGIDVDQHGCIDLTMFSKPMVLNIDYPSGSFEIDPRNRERLNDLARVLKFVPGIRLDINGYTDNIGTIVANRKLSEKRANRVRDYLVTLGIAAERIKVFGKGETSFVASNDTAEGRAKNRRIEIIFYK